MSEIIRDDGFTPVLKYKKNKKGETVIPASIRADGSVRKEKKIKEGYLPPEEQPVYDAKKALENKGYQACPGLDFVVVDDKKKPKKKKKKEKKIEINEANSDMNEDKKDEVIKDKSEDKIKKKKYLKKKITDCEKLSQMQNEGMTLAKNQLDKLSKLEEYKKELAAL